MEPKPFEQITPDEWVRIVSNNTLAPFLCTRAVVPKMRKRRYGRIVNLTSGTVFVGVPHVLAYVASKGAVAVMTKALAKELSGDGINVNAVAPGLTMTQSMKDNGGWTSEIQDRSIQNRTIKREETADDLVGACLFFAGSGADRPPQTARCPSTNLGADRVARRERRTLDPAGSVRCPRRHAARRPG